MADNDAFPQTEPWCDCNGTHVADCALNLREMPADLPVRVTLPAPRVRGWDAIFATLGAALNGPTEGAAVADTQAAVPVASLAAGTFVALHGETYTASPNGCLRRWWDGGVLNVHPSSLVVPIGERPPLNGPSEGADHG